MKEEKKISTEMNIKVKEQTEELKKKEKKLKELEEDV